MPETNGKPAGSGAPSGGAASGNVDLIGAEGSRSMLSTPALVLDLDVFEANIVRMKAMSDASGIALRPHAKAHKCSAIARRQLEAGAIGLCCATLDEATVMADAGATDILLTSPVAGDRKVRRLVELAGRCPGFKGVVDHRGNVSAISEAAAGVGTEVALVVDIDPGLNRTGAVSDADVVALAHLVDGSPGLKFCGIQCYSGHLQFIQGRAVRAAKAAALTERLIRLRAELTEAGLEPLIVSGGGTGTAELESPHALTELQVGSYIFMDGKYARVFTGADEALPFQPALFVSSTVINAHRPGQVTIDAGTKALVNGWLPPPVVRPADLRADYEFAGDEHGRLIYRDSAGRRLEPGDHVELFVPHCDPNVDLFAFYHCVRGDRLVDIWPIDARSRR